MDMCSGRSASAASRWIHGLSPSRSKVIMMAQRAPPGHFTADAMGAENRPALSPWQPRQGRRMLGGAMNIFKAQAVKDAEAVTRAIPVIDFGPAFRGEPGGLEAVARQVRRASEEIGFFYLAGHGVPDAVVEAAFAASREFHALPDAVKGALAIN